MVFADGVRHSFAGNKRFYVRLAVLGFFAVVALYIALRYAWVISGGGQYWATGDWLIHYGSGFVRRGLTGSVTLTLAQWTGGNPVEIAGATQIAVYAAMMAVVLFNFAHVRWSTPVLLLLFSPVLLLMPFYYTKLSMLKEMLGFLGLGLMVVSAHTRNPRYLPAGAAVLALAGFAHEINAFLAPAAVVLLWLCARAGIISRREVRGLGALIVAIALATLILSSAYSGHGQSEAICAELLLRADAALFCQPEGPVMWLERDTAFGIGFMWQENVQTGVWPWFVLGYGLSIAPFFLFRVTGDESGRVRARLLLGVVLGIVIMAPLFLVATDWGRWISIYVFGLTMISLAALKFGYITARQAPAWPLVALYGFGWSMADYGQPLAAGIFSKMSNAAHWIEQLLPGWAG